MADSIDVVCLSHLRWDFVYQRPQHLLSRCARDRRVFFFEEPIFDAERASLDLSLRADDGVHVAVPRLPAGTGDAEVSALLRKLIDELFEEQRIEAHILWYYTPMAIPFTRHLRPLAIVYDCMDELSAFRGAPPMMRAREVELLRRADIVFTGGHSLYEAKRHAHPNVHPFPSSVDTAHFARARTGAADPPDQAQLRRPRVGFFGVIDERMDMDLLGGVADLRPDLELVMVGPIVKIEPAAIPRRPNIHWLGAKSYKELPEYIAGWDVAMLPFARSSTTRFISPTKTPEYLAAGKPVVSTSIPDVVRPYGEEKLARIADTPSDFVQAIDDAMREDVERRMRRVTAILARTSWDRTWSRMSQLIEAAVSVHGARRPSSLPPPPPTSVGASPLSVQGTIESFAAGAE